MIHYKKIYVLLIIIVAYFNLQDELSVKLLDFLESPHSTTDSLLAEKELVQLILHLLLPFFHSATFCYDFGTLEPYVYCNVVILLSCYILISEEEEAKIKGQNFQKHRFLGQSCRKVGKG